MGEDLELIEAELDEALNTIDDMVNVIANLILEIACENQDCICTQCLDTAKELYKLMKNYAREEDTVKTAAHFENITGRKIDE